MDIEDFSQLIEKRLQELLQAEGPLFDAARYSVFSGGKRLRPLLTLSACHTLGGSLEKALDPACALELVHTYSLIHDDLPCMDDDDLRRGKPTLHRAFPEWHALLTGDYLLTFAFEILTQSPVLSAEEKIDCVHILATRAGGHGMIGGQMLDLLSETVPIDSVTLQSMHVKKTAALISAALELGAIAAGAAAKDRALLRECGIKIGLAFQIMDDILDTKDDIPNSAEKVTFNKAGAPDLQQAKSVSKQPMCKHMGDGDSCEGGDAGAVKSDFFSRIRYKHNKPTAVSLLGVKEAQQLKDSLLEECLETLNALSHPSLNLQILFQKLAHRIF